MVTTEPDGRNNIQNGPEAGQPVGTDCRTAGRYRPKYYKQCRTSGWSSRTDDWEDGPDAWLGDNRHTSKERTKCTETAKVAGQRQKRNQGGRMNDGRTNTCRKRKDRTGSNKRSDGFRPTQSGRRKHNGWKDLARPDSSRTEHRWSERPREATETTTMI